ncbi:MAG: hypothetical protein M1838_002754 [Thelocarpon superellum]|nr:MAG: hypothetical protein M1838_002754 [Thelocarpon superellum]
MKLCQEFHDEDPVELRQLRNSLRMSPGDWTMISLFAFMLFFIPCLLGLLVSYYTPVVAVSCRSLTCIVYAAAQTVLLLLWIWNFTWRDQRWYDRRKSWRREDREARVERDLRNGSILSMPRRLEPDGQHPSASEKASAGLPWSRVQRFIFWPLMVISVGVATFSAIGGTMLQIMGGYRNCVCWIATSAWASPSSSMLLLSTNSADDISYASRTWLSIGGVATGFLAIVCYFGWWYQRRLRHQFTALVVDLDRYQVGGSRKRG